MTREQYITQLSRCVRCGTCKAYCPTYDEGLTEAMSARGRLMLLRGLLTGRIGPSPLLNERIYGCVLCGACENSCPPRLDITGAMYYGRRLLRDSDRERRSLRLLTRLSLRKPALSYRVARIFQNVALPHLVKKGLPFRISVPPQPLRDDRQVYKPGKKIGRVGLFTGCSVNYLFPHLGISLINVLLRLGYEVVLPKGEVCCGVPLRGLGLEEDAVEMAEKNYSIFSKLNVDAIVSLCPTCIVALKIHYPELIGRRLDNVMDISNFLSGKLGSHGPRPLRTFTSVTYHDPCHLNYSMGVRKEPRDLIRYSGADLIEAGSEGCCGFGGLFSLEFRDISRDLLKKRLGVYNRTGADAIITSCPGCMLQLGSGPKEEKVFHLIELVEEALCGDEVG